jgi:manganese-dependent inorganic pyrophosphatase
MLSGILSDTLLFKSPTTTSLDIEVGNALALICKEDIQEYGYKMFRAASSVYGMNVSDIIHTDLKTFKFGDRNVAIGQVMTMDFDDIARKQDELVEHLNEMYKAGYKMTLLFVTDIMRNGSYLFYNDEAKEFLEDAYDVKDLEQGNFFEGFVSRKKQMLPPLIELSERRN